MYRIFLYLKRRGFTLAEILVATVIAGYCIMPIVGSMQGGIRHTENFNHREKLRMLARSRLNKELAAGAFDHSAINTESMYHYVYRLPDDPNYLTCDTPLASDAASFTDLLGITPDDIIYSYRVSVSTRENINISTTTASIDPDMLKSPRGLKAVVVNAELLDGPYVIATDSLSYFSLVTLPSFGDQFIWLSNSSMLRILAVDSTTRAIAETFQLPYDATKAFDKPEQDVFRPWNIDLHPSRRVLGVQGRTKIRLLNIDRSHASYQQSAGFVDIAAHPGTNADPNKNIYANVVANSSKAEEDRGIVFRPDGKYFFVSSHGDKSLYVYKIDVATASALNWPPPVAFVKRFGLAAAEEGNADTENDKFTDMISGNDGYLYLSIKDKKNVIRFPMYPSSFTSGWTFEQLLAPFAEAVNSTWTSKDGKYVYIIGDNKKVAQYQSQPLARIGTATFDADENFRDIKLSHDSRYLMMTDKADATNKGGLRGKLINEVNFAANPAAITMTRAYPYKVKADLAVLSPTGNDVLFTHKDKPEMYFIDIASLAANFYATSIPGDRILTYDSTGKPCADIVTRVPEHMLVGTNDSTIEFFDLHTFKFDEDRRIVSLRGVPRTIGVSPQGTRFKVGYASDTSGVDAYNMIDSSNISVNELSGNSKVVAYSADDETVRRASGVATYSDNFFANLEIPGSAGSFNGYWIANAPGGSFGNSDIDTAWVPQDMKAMPNGGFLMLYKKSDGSAMLDWIGKIKWGTSDRGRYKRFARWITTAHNQFPPAWSQNIAISPDEQFLAIEASGTPNLVYLYDFGACNFGHETQLEGWLADYRVQSQPVTAANPASWIFGNVAANTYFTVPNVTNSSTTGIRLKDSVTSNESWTSMVNYPSNFIVNSGDPVTGGTNPSKRDVNRRYFGYFTPDYLANKFLVYSRDYARMFYNHEPKGYWANTGSDGSFGSAIGQIALTTSVIQTDYMTNGGNVKLGLFTHINSAQATGTISADGSSEASNLDMDTSWTRIASTHTRPFNFQPIFLRSYPIPGCNGDSANALAFSRDRANPILFLIDAGNDDLWALKPGKSITRIDVDDTFSDTSDKQLVVSPDGQKLIFAEESGQQRIFVTNIGNPDSFAFDGTPVSQSSIPPASFGSLITTVNCGASPKALGVMPFNSYKSTSRTGKYELVATLSAQLYGNNSAALSNGGIYIMGGAPSTTSNPVNYIYKFEPMNPATVNALAITLNKSVKLNSVIAYEDKIYSFNGALDTSVTNVTDWVQRYDPGSADVISSFDPGASGLPDSYQVNYTMTDATHPAPPQVSDSGDIYGSYPGYMAFDGLTDIDHPWVTNTANQYVDYFINNPEGSCIINRLRIHNGVADPDGGVKGFEFYGYDSTWHLIEVGTATYNQTNWIFDFPNSTPYQTYRFKVTSRHNSASYYGLRELWMDMANVRRITPWGNATSVSGYTATYGTPVTHTIKWSSDNSSLYGSLAFDTTLNSTSRWDCGDTAPDGWLRIELATPDKAHILRINGEYGDQCPKSFTLYATNVPANDHTALASWDTLLTVTNSPNNNEWNTYHFANSTNYSVYMIIVTLCHGGSGKKASFRGLQLYSTEPGVSAPSEPIMTKTMNDTRSSIAVSSNAACMTPYGIFMAGGLDASNSSTGNCLIYWPHALDEYTDATNHSFGISRSLPNLPVGFNVYAHNLVWHKGKVYRVGGYHNSGLLNNPNTVAVFDFDTNSWSNISTGDTNYFTDIKGDALALPQPAYAGVCSFGDEIFIFGGMIGPSPQNTAWAWNPESKVVRQLGNLPAAKAGICAVPCGSSIYLIGGANPLAAEAAATPIYKFTP